MISVSCLPHPVLPIAMASVVLTAAGCFSHIPIDPASIRNGEAIRVHINHEAAVQLSTRTGRIDSNVTGRMVELSSEAISILVRSAQHDGRSIIEGGQRTYTFPRPQVLAVERRRLDVGRTALAGVGVAAIVLLSFRAGGGGGGGPGAPGDRPPGDPGAGN